MRVASSACGVPGLQELMITALHSERCVPTKALDSCSAMVGSTHGHSI